MRKAAFLLWKALAVVAIVLCPIRPITTFAADPVDLRGKQGVVDPKDLKKSDPPPNPLKIKEPPAPDTRSEKEKAKAKKPGSVGGVRD
jgi:hypothetical protein